MRIDAYKASNKRGRKLIGPLLWYLPEVVVYVLLTVE